MSPIRWSLLGAGPWACMTHVPGLARVAAAGRIELAGVWSRRQRSREAAAAQLGVSAFDDLDALLALSDAAIVCVVPNAQPALAIRAAQHGCHLLLEKPLALRSRDSAAVAAAVRGAGVCCETFFTLRYDGTVSAWFTAAARETWSHATLRWLTELDYDGSPWKQPGWRGVHGARWDLAPHLLAVALPLFGAVDGVRQHTSVDGLVTRLELDHRCGTFSTIEVAHHHPEPTISLRLTAPGRVTELNFSEIDAVAASAAAIDEVTAAAEKKEQPAYGNLDLSVAIVDTLAAADPGTLADRSS